MQIPNSFYVVMISLIAKPKHDIQKNQNMLSCWLSALNRLLQLSSSQVSHPKPFGRIFFLGFWSWREKPGGETASASSPAQDIRRYTSSG
jgi:hypothetical protein